MKTWKRNALIAYLVCCLIAIVAYCILVLSSGFPGFFRFLLLIPCVALLAGLCLGCYILVKSLSRRQAMLHSGPGGVVNIELGALESTARRSLASLQGISLIKVEAVVSDRKGSPVIDMSVTAVPFGVESLMTTANRIERSVKQAVESFTDHEVRSVSVNFVEPQNKEERKAAEDAVDARARMFGDSPDKAPWQAPYAGVPAGAATYDPAGIPNVAAEGAGSSDSFLDKIKKAISGRSASRNEDVVEATASVCDAASDGEPSSDARAVDVEPDGEGDGREDGCEDASVQTGSGCEDCGQGVEDEPVGFDAEEQESKKRVSSEPGDSENR